MDLGEPSSLRGETLVLRGPGCEEKTHRASSYLGEAGQTAPPGYQGHEVTGPGLTLQDRTAGQGRATPGLPDTQRRLLPRAHRHRAALPPSAPPVPGPRSQGEGWSGSFLLRRAVGGSGGWTRVPPVPSWVLATPRHSPASSSRSAVSLLLPPCPLPLAS